MAFVNGTPSTYQSSAAYFTESAGTILMLSTFMRFAGRSSAPSVLVRGDFFQHVVAFDQFAEGGVLAVEKLRVAVADEKLAAGRIGILRARHREHAAHVRFVVELGLDLVAGIAGAPARLLALVLGQRIAALDHEALDDAMKAVPS